MSTYIVNDNGVNRQMTKDETEAYEIAATSLAADIAKTEAAKKAIAIAKQSALTKLKTLGLTDDEINAIIG